MKLLAPSVAAVPVILAGLKLASAIFALVTELAANMAFVTPPLAIPNVAFPDVPPPVSPVPAVTAVIVPPPTPVAALLITLPSGKISAPPLLSLRL